MTCSFTIDNVVDSATYEGITLAITGDENLATWTEEKSVTFESCYDSSPGTLVIKGSDNDVGGISMLTFYIKRRYPRVKLEVTHQLRLQFLIVQIEPN